MNDYLSCRPLRIFLLSALTPTLLLVGCSEYRTQQQTLLSSTPLNSEFESSPFEETQESPLGAENPAPGPEEENTAPTPEEENTAPVEENTGLPDCTATANNGNLQQQIDQMQSGTLCLTAGNYSAITIQNKQNTSENNLFVLRPAPGAEGSVVFRGNSVNAETMIKVFASKYIVVAGFRITNSQKAIVFASVQGGAIIDNQIERVGMEAIHVGRFYGGSARGDLPSSDIDILRNTIDSTGLRPPGDGDVINQYSEGIYIGNGSGPSQDRTHDIMIADNRISNTGAEAIEIKPYTYNISILRNTISDISLRYSGAITVSVGRDGPNDNGNYLIQGNDIRRVTTREHSIGAIVVAHGKARVFDNVMSDIEGNIGVRIYNSMDAENPEFRTVEIKGNTGAMTQANQSSGGYPNMNAIVVDLDNL